MLENQMKHPSGRRKMTGMHTQEGRGLETVSPWAIVKQKTSCLNEESHIVVAVVGMMAAKI